MSNGYNSDDEHNHDAHSRHTTEEWKRKQIKFERELRKLGLEIRVVEGDGACMFRSISIAKYANDESHAMVRRACIRFMIQNKSKFVPYITEDFDEYIARKARVYTFGNSAELMAMALAFDRPIEVYSYR